MSLARDAIEKIYARGHIPILTGGTGFYIQAVLRDINFAENDNDSIYRKELERIAESEGPEYIHQMLLEKDPESAAAIHPNNVKKVIRALEFLQQTGEKISDHNRIQAEQKSPYNFAYFVLNLNREKLYARIDQRVDKMIEAGLVQEVKKLMDQGFTPRLVSMQGLGYKEICAYLTGECTLQEAAERIKLGTRHFAKRQLTWFRREKEVIWLDKDSYASEDELLQDMLQILNEKKIISNLQR